jgi:hypothetical protein
MGVDVEEYQDEKGKPHNGYKDSEGGDGNGAIPCRHTSSDGRGGGGVSDGDGGVAIDE